MVSRFKRRAAPPEVTFFVFQDILTSMIGVMIMVTLTLGLQINDSALDGNDHGKLQKKLAAELAQVLSEVTTLRSKIAAMGKTAGYTPSADSIESELAQLRSEVAVFEKSNQGRQERVQKLAINPADAVIAGEVKDLNKVSAGLAAERDRLISTEDDGKNRLSQATNAVSSAESQLKDEENRREVLRLIPEMSGTTKAPVLVIVSHTGFKMTRYDTSAQVAEGKSTDFQDGLKKLNSADQYVVLFVRPSAARQFGDYLKAAKHAGFEVGYDLVGEDVKFEFSKK